MAKPESEVNPETASADTNAVTTTAGTPAPPEAEEEASDQPDDPSRIEVVSVTDEDLPIVDTPTTLNVSPLGSPDPNSPEAEDFPPFREPSPAMPITKVQPFMIEDDLEPKTWKVMLLARRVELLIGACVLVLLILILGIGLGVGLSCMGKFRCGSSSRCISSSAQCDGTEDCEHGEDELSCVRLSGRSSVLQVLSGGVWRTVCSEDWNNILGYSACKQLGYSSYVESRFLYLSSVEQDFQSNLVSINLSQPGTQIVKIHNTTNLRMIGGRSVSSVEIWPTWIVLYKRDCGSRPRFTSRIVGGNISQPGQFPWQVSLHFKSEHLCGGSIVDARWIVTAAHCVFGFAYPTMWAVHAGMIEQPVNGALSLAVEKIIYHSQYRPKGLDYDIALMRLAEPLNFNGLIEPICLPNFGEEFREGTFCWISGWGTTEDGGQSSVSLLSARVPLISTKTCSQPGVYQGFISSWMICAGYLEGGTDSCQGDSGGPLACMDSSLWKLVGATSWGMGCGDRNKPGVYTHITQALNWIHQQMEREEARQLNTF